MFSASERIYGYSVKVARIYGVKAFFTLRDGNDNSADNVCAVYDIINKKKKIAPLSRVLSRCFVITARVNIRCILCAYACPIRRRKHCINYCYLRVD